MSEHRLKMVWFNGYCQKCKYLNKKENEEPCDECLEHPINEDSHKPVKFEDKGE